MNKIDNLFKKNNINYEKGWSPDNKYKKFINLNESFIIKANSSVYRKMAKKIASNNLYVQYKNNKCKYPPVYIYKNIFTMKLQNFTEYKSIWKKSDGLVFDGLDEWQNNYEFTKISDFITYRIYNEKKTVLISSTNLEKNIKNKNGFSFLSLLNSLKSLEIK